LPKADAVFSKSCGNKGKWAVCGHSPAAGGAAATVDVDFTNVCGHLLNVGGDFPAVNAGCRNVGGNLLDVNGDFPAANGG
jgi:hypothetical protein